MIHYNVDTNVRKNVLISIFIISLLINIFITRKINAIKIVHEINLPYTIELLINSLPLPSIFGILYYFFDNFLWKIKYINFFLGIPNLNGEWEGTYWSNFKCLDPDNCKCQFYSNCSSKSKGFLNGECIVPGYEKKCMNYTGEGVKGNINFKIIQTFTKISIYSNHNKSNSKNRATSMLLDNKPNGEMTLLYEHLNEIDIFKAEDNMKNHSGFNKLNYIMDKGQEILEGIYYNDPNRQTYGKIKYIKIKD